ncbi:hypothetical protein BO82DRAFT_180249 [Aspergillus uvarum CBS 121591]|uniref:Secreted protein n=1 Tax=Aspergillus uvarum CBS 121591 TaxID=1448315 RepID=A0A319DBV3_9EURO|nr:hypothetical protein BO82DRAFT_180249 [Aspergillus uvarum CBS 121591]PYH77342.1 hypothetical protein BO82DRAFT_180249 [Aspergillus uvarum CBS 121591]
MLLCLFFSGMIHLSRPVRSSKRLKWLTCCQRFCIYSSSDTDTCHARIGLKLALGLPHSVNRLSPTECTTESIQKTSLDHCDAQVQTVDVVQILIPGTRLGNRRRKTRCEALLSPVVTIYILRRRPHLNFKYCLEYVEHCFRASTGP